jgi:Flp pilus assembly protein TadG
MKIMIKINFPFCFKKQGSAQALVEFALVLPLLLTLMFGIMEFGYFFYHHYSLADGVEHGTRAGAMGKEDSIIKQNISKFSGLKLNENKILINRPQNPSKGKLFSVTASYDHMLLTPLFGKKSFLIKINRSMAIE